MLAAKNQYQMNMQARQVIGFSSVLTYVSSKQVCF